MTDANRQEEHADEEAAEQGPDLKLENRIMAPRDRDYQDEGEDA